MATPYPFAAALLAGGMSRRMGQDKAFLDWQGTPLWKVQWDKLAALHPAQLIVSCRQDQTAIQAPDTQILHDPMVDQGPVIALQRCLESTKLPLLVLAVDMLRMPIEFLRLLTQASPTNGLVYSSAHGFEPLCAMYPQSVTPLVARHRRLQSFVQEAIDSGLLKTQRLTPAQEAYFVNINTPSDWSLSCPPPQPLSPSPSPGLSGD